MNAVRMWTRIASLARFSRVYERPRHGAAARSRRAEQRGASIPRTLGTVAVSRRLAIATFLAVAAAGCGDGPTAGSGGSSALQFTPASAPPLAVVTVTGLPADYGTAPTPITVGGRDAVLSPLDSTRWAFLVPAGVTAGDVTVRLPGGGDAAPQSKTLSVVTPTLIGGTTEATLRAMNDDFADVQASLAGAQPTLNPKRDSLLVRRLLGLNVLLEQVQGYVATLAPDEAAAFAAYYSANRAHFEQVFDLLIELANDAAKAPPLSPSVLRGPAGGAGLLALDGLGTSPAATSSAAPAVALRPQSAATQAAGDADLVGRCEQYIKYMRVFNLLDQTLDVINVGLQAAGAVPLPHLKAAAAVGTAVTVAMDLASIFLNQQPVLFVSNGLRLEFQPARVSPGGSGVMRASLELRAAGGVQGSVGSVVLDVVLARVRAVRASIGLSVSLLTEVLVATGLESALVGVENLLNDIGAQHAQITGSGPTQRGFTVLNPVQYGGGSNATLWSFTTPNSELTRGFRAEPGTSSAEELVTQGATIGTEPGCTASTDAPAPESGFNGFVITAQNAVSITPGRARAVVRQGGGPVPTTLGALNLTTVQASGLSYSLTSATGAAASLPAGLTVTLGAGPNTLAGSETRNFTVTVSATGAVPLGQYQVPVSIRQAVSGAAPRLLAATVLTIDVTSQFANIVVNTLTPALVLYDNGNLEDGDRVSVTLNGKTVYADFSLLHAFTVTGLTLRPGGNVLIITALNEGTSPPNTAAYQMSNVVSGPATQGYSLATGQVVSLTIIAEVPPSPSRAANAGVPAVSAGRLTNPESVLLPRLPVQCEGSDTRDCARAP